MLSGVLTRRVPIGTVARGLGGAAVISLAFVVASYALTQTTASTGGLTAFYQAVGWGGFVVWSLGFGVLLLSVLAEFGWVPTFLTLTTRRAVWVLSPIRVLPLRVPRSELAPGFKFQNGEIYHLGLIARYEYRLILPSRTWTFSTTGPLATADVDRIFQGLARAGLNLSSGDDVD